MNKQAGALLTIGEAAEQLGIKPHILRYWEDQFPTLSPLKRAGGRRYYRAEDMALLKKIDRMVNAEGFTIAGARKALARRAPVESAEPAIRLPGEAALLPDVEQALRSVRGRLERAKALIDG